MCTLRQDDVNNKKSATHLSSNNDNVRMSSPPSPCDRRQLELECHCAILSRTSLLLNPAFTKLPTMTKLRGEAVTGLGPLPPHTGSEDRPTDRGGRGGAE